MGISSELYHWYSAHLWLTVKWIDVLYISIFTVFKIRNQGRYFFAVNIIDNEYSSSSGCSNGVIPRVLKFQTAFHKIEHNVIKSKHTTHRDGVGVAGARGVARRGGGREGRDSVLASWDVIGRWLPAEDEALPEVEERVADRELEGPLAKEGFTCEPDGSLLPDNADDIETTEPVTDGALGWADPFVRV
jgi:hypothetical protein